MGDVWMIAAILGSFAILVGFVVACDKIVGPDPASTQSSTEAPRGEVPPEHNSNVGQSAVAP